MTGIKKEKQNTNSKLRSSSGMTMAEVLTTVAILLILAGVAFVALFAYQRSLAQTERDGIAKEIFIAAQNHLTMARGEGYMGITEDADAKDDSSAEYKKVYGDNGNWSGESGVRYFIVNGKDGGTSVSDFTQNNSSVLDQMLPFGSVDETVRAGGSYIIRYQPKTGTVLDVFYCSVSGSPAKFNHELTRQEYDDLSGLVDTEDADGNPVSRKKARRSYTDGSVLGWYGGAEAAQLKRYSFEAPSVDLVNGDTLYAEVINNEKSHETLTEIRLIITGVTSGAKAAFRMSDTNDRLVNDPDNIHIFTLDDITRSGMHFADLAGQTPMTKPVAFIPGEDVKAEAVVYSNSALGIAYSGAETENSLFESIADTSEVDVNSKGKMYEDGTKHAYIGSIRHLENLSPAISKSGSGDKAIVVAAASQTTDLYWDNFHESSSRTIAGFKGASQYAGVNKGRGTGGTENVNQGKVVDMSAKDAGGYYPVDHDADSFETYDGLRHSIYYVETASDYSGDAGLFGNAACKIKNIALVDFNIHGSGSVGALAGSSGGTVLNVIAFNSNDKDHGHEDDPKTATVVSGDGAAGGLIGSMTGGSMKYCGAALVVKGKTIAGGLIGEVNSNDALPIEASYSGGHTIKGEYYEHEKNNSGNYTDKRKTKKEGGKDVPVPLYNVRAVNGNNASGTAGGLIGAAKNANIKNCYSTCSVEGKKETSGGFVGDVDDSSIEHSYCTGLVSGGWEDKKINNKSEKVLADNAFMGSCDAETSSKLSNAAGKRNYYFEIVNEFEREDGSGMSYKSSGNNNVVPLDRSFDDKVSGSKDVYNDFVYGDSAWNEAKPYDSVLKRYYKGSAGKRLYNLKTVTQLEDTAEIVQGKEKAKAEVPKSGNPQDPGSLFVNTHYGDWPVPEIFIINN